MTVAEIREAYVNFFKTKGHEIVDSAPMVVKDDPTLMFTNAGMNQFKDYFLGYRQPQYKRIANSQKCLRVSGKHNDLEEVGVDTYHHTMFEMLGNWSFGDYFKVEAIEWAWELLTEVYQLPKERLYVTIFEGDASDNVPRDEESENIWKKFIDAERIIAASKKDNFWEMGDTGPCGPCTEIHVDLRSETDRMSVDGKSLVNQDHPQVIEIWNLVFMQFNRKANGSLEKLPATHVDTGMGLERLAMALQAKQSNYDIDLFQALIQFLEQKSNLAYGQSESKDIAMRVIADHIRAIAFSIADGQLPSNTGAGYVIRRILRRAVRYGYQNLELKDPFLFELSEKLERVMGAAYPELTKNKELIYKVIKEEETSFFRTLESGLKRIQSTIDQIKEKNEISIKGEAVFELYDTYGFPEDLTALIARENGLSIDEEGFQTALKAQKDRSRAATSVTAEDWVELRDDDVEEFIGYDYLEADVKLVKYRQVTQKKKTFYQLVLNITPFYPEGGGQVGDSGYLIDSSGEKTRIFDTKKENNLIVHLSDKLPTNVQSNFKAVVDQNKRWDTAANHSATHLLHHALRKVLGEHVEQKGSLVHPDYLRFDFSHFSKMTEEELEAVHQEIDRQVKANLPLEERRDLPLTVAKEMGVMMLFGEKYGDTVRMIQFGESKELCGGTHVTSTGQIGMFKIQSESAVAAGIRRIELLTGRAAERYFRACDAQIAQVKALLKSTQPLETAVQQLVDKTKALQDEIDRLKKAQGQQLKSDWKEAIQTLENGVRFLKIVVDTDAGTVKDILFQLRGETEKFVGIVGAKEGDKCSLNVMIDDELAKTRQWHAGNYVKHAARYIQGGGGGQPFFATAGGKAPSGLEAGMNEIAAQMGLG